MTQVDIPPVPDHLPEPDFSENAHVILRARYLAKDIDGNPVETPAEMIWRVAYVVAAQEQNYPQSPWYEKWEELAEKFYNLMASRIFLPNSPTLMNAGRPLGQLAACFVLPIEDSMEGIFKSVKDAALIHKSGGGTGFSFSRLREENSRVGSTGGVASGPVSFLKIFDTATEQVKQGGTRRGANMGVLRVDHPDIRRWIEAKEQEGDIANFNLSVGITNDFMHAVRCQGSFPLISPHTGKEVERVDAAALFRRICELAHKNGEPGVLFLDTINQANVTPELGDIEATNPCVTGDIWVNTDKGLRKIKDIVGEPVMLRINNEWWNASEGFFETGEREVYELRTNRGYMAAMTLDHKVSCADGWKELREIQIGDSVELDHSDISNWKHLPDHNGGGKYLATVSSIDPIGIKKVYDVRIPGKNAFSANGIIVHNCGEEPLLPYEACNLGSINISIMQELDALGQEVDLEEVVSLCVRFLDNVIDASQYPLPEIQQAVSRTRKIGLGIMGWADYLFQRLVAYDSNEACDLGFKMMQTIQGLSKRASETLAKERGPCPALAESTPRRRNADTTTIAPTGTLSMIAGCSSGIEPTFALAQTKTCLDGQQFIEINKHFSSNPEIKELGSDIFDFVHQHGRLPEHAPGKLRRVFRTAQEISPQAHLNMQEAFQEYTDAAVSKTINMPTSATVDDVAEVYMLAWEMDCKGLTVYRDGSRDKQVYTSGVAGERDKDKHQLCAPGKKPRPEILSGFTQQVQTGLGKLYLTVNELDGKPFEVFATIGQSGKSQTAKAEAVGRLVSLCLRSDVPLENIVGQIEGIGGDYPMFSNGRLFKSIPDAVGWILRSNYMQGEKPASSSPDLQGKSCPECGGELAFQEGCFLCQACGYTKCG